MKRRIAYICIIIFSFQVIPVKEIGKVLLKAGMTEEAANNCSHMPDDDASKQKKKDEPIHYSEKQQACARIALLTQKVNTALHESEHLLQDFTADILTPPPDRS